jgi:hypothetical protein
MELKLELEPVRMPIAVSFAETAAKSARLGERESALLALSVEELFMALCEVMPGAMVELCFHDRRYAVDLLLHFLQAPPDLRIFNITARPDHETEQGLANMGLFLASRACDQFSVQQLSSGSWEIMLRKERSYPAVQQNSQLPHNLLQSWRIISTPSPDAVKQLSGLIHEKYTTAQFPEEFTPPGRLVDKLASNNYGVILGQDADGELAGGLIWRTTEQRIIECFGPYLQSPAEPELLVEALCEKVVERFGRSDRLGMVLYAPQQPSVSAGFEPAGALATPQGSVWTGYRMMSEEFGAKALVHQELLTFYSGLSSSMALARTIREYHDDGESGDGLTLFGTRLNRTAGMARLTPLLVGRDAGQVLDEHLQLLDSEGFFTIYCTLDTGRPFDALLTPHLLACGFTPGMLIPWGGTGDLLYLHRNRSSR